MTEDTVRKVVLEAVRQETGFDAATIDPDQDIRRQVNLDSMQFVGILARVEEALNVELPIEGVMVNTLNEFLDIVRREVANA